MPAVDVLIPTRNRPELARRALSSVLSQTMDDFQVILVDDHSDDDAFDELKTVAATDGRVTLLRTPERLGPALARQFALDQSGAQLVATLDSDDEWLPTKLERQCARLESTGSGVALCWFDWVRPDGSVRVTRRYSGEGRVSPVLTNNMDVPLARRALIESVGGYRGDEWSPHFCDEHTDFMIRLLSSAKVTTVPEVLVRCHDHDGPRASDEVSRQVDSLRLILTGRRDRFVGFEDDLSGLEARFAARLLASRQRGPGVRQLASALRAASWPKKISLAREYVPFAAKSLLLRP